MTSPNLRWRAYIVRLTTSYIQYPRFAQGDSCLVVICPSRVVTFDQLEVCLGIGLLVLLQLLRSYTWGDKGKTR